MHDPEIRKLLKQHLSADFRKGATIIEELGVGHGFSRADLVLIGKDLHVFEVKSNFDSLTRLPDQLTHYLKVFDKVTVVAAYRHLDSILENAPASCGILLATPGQAALGFIRRPTPNDQIDSLELARLLWREEALDILDQLGLAAGSRSKPREDVYFKLCEAISRDEIRTHVIARLRSRLELGLVGKRTPDGG
jgi:hypothetical protein